MSRLPNNPYARDEITAEMERLCQWMLRVKEGDIHDLWVALDAGLTHACGRCPDIADILLGQDPKFERRVEGKRSVATITIGEDVFTASLPTLDENGAPVCWPWA